jgi:ribonuclease T1
LRHALLVGALLCFTAAWSAEIHVSEVPVEARATLELIKAGGPFPYPQDGRVFSNREKRLPLKRRGYYREYTVRTPGVRDRGARRIVAGSGGEYYYTADHYRSFRRILE